METGKPGLASAPVHISSVAAQAEKKMDIQAPLTAVYIHTVPALPAQHYPQQPAAAPEPATLHLAMPPLYSKETLPFLTLHIAGGLQSQPGLSLAAAAPAARPKSAGKHVCPHCGRDCMKPSVLEKHLRCHTGERPYPCTTCGVSFKTQSNLYKHRRTQAHARLSSESEQSSLDSMSSSRETCTSSLSLEECSEESGSMEKDSPLAAAESTSPARTTKVCSVKTQSSQNEENEPTLAGQNSEPNKSETVIKESEKLPLTVSRHLPLQRQEAFPLFSKQWESSVSRGKSQNHESTDSGFSETSDHYPSQVLLDHSMDSFAESTKEHLEEPTSRRTPIESDHGRLEPKDSAKEQEQKSLEERISKLISDNTAVVEDKQLENVRPRKTVLSKQGSIDLPMPYTYKDSFHFDMRIGQTQNFLSQRNKKPGLYSSVPTQRSTMEHTPLTRSNSLPFSVTLLQPERSSPTSSNQRDYVTLVRRGSSGQINPTGFTIKPVNQQSSTHRPLVRQTAVDCNHATDGLTRNSSVEEACTGSLSCDGDGGDICGEPSNRKFRRKKAQKFAYNKWYMYGGGTFKKLYNAEKSSDNSVIKARKCSANPEHEVVQALQKRAPLAVTRTVSTINLTSNSTAAGPPANLSLVSAMDFNPQTNLLNSSCIPLKAPLQRNLSLSVLPLPSIGSLVGPKTDSVNRSEAGRLMNKEKHTVSTSQLCGAHIPSDRKKLRTDDKIICPLQMETDPNTVITHPAPSVTQQDANLTYINLHNNPQHTQLKGPLFQPGIINAKASSVSTSAAASIPSVAKNSFLPKYQLKLPNLAEPDLNFSPQVVDKPTGTEVHTFASARSSPHIEQSATSVTTSVKNCKDPITSQLMLTSETKKTNAFNSTRDQLVSTICHAATSRNLPCSVAVVHKQFATTTITTSCLQDYQAGLCSTLMQPSKCMASAQQPRAAAPAIAALTVTTASNQTSAAAVKAVSYDQSYLCPNPPLSHMQLSAQSNVLNPVSIAHVSTNTPVVPCHIVPFDQMQPAAQNVFHVHTADLQICLQIISDEQLALIEPQIERQSGPTLSQRQDTEVVTLEGVQNKTQGFNAVDCSNEAKDIKQPRQQKDKNESCPTLTSERIMTSVPTQFGKAEPSSHVAQSNFTRAAASAESIPPETPGPPLHPHKNSHVNMVTESQSTAGDVMSTAAPFGGVKSGRRQTSEEEQALSLNRCGEEQLSLDRKVGQGGMDVQTLSGQHKLSRSSPSSSTVNQNNLKSELLCKEGQHKLNNQGASSNVCTVKTKDEAFSRLESAEYRSHSPTPACSDRLSESVSSFPISESKAVGEPKPQASIYCSNRVEPTISETLNPSKDANMGCDRVGSLSDSNLLLEISPHGSQDIISSGHSEKRLAQFASVSSNIQVERYKDTPPVCPSIQIPTAGLMEGASLVGCAAQKELQIQEHAGTPGEPDNTDWRQKESQGAEEKNHQCFGEQGDGGVMGEEENRGIKADSMPGLWGKAESDCRSTVLSKPEEEGRKVKNESFKNPWPAEEHLQHLSQTHSGMSEYPPLSPQHVLSTSSNLNIPASSIQTTLFTFPKPPLEINHFYHSQHNWETSVIHNQPTQALTELNSSRHINAGAHLSQTENVFSRTESGLQQTFSVQDQKQTSISLSVQQENTAAGNNSTAVSSCKKFNLASHQNSNVGTLPPTDSNQVSQVCRVAAGSRGDVQPSKMYHNTGSPSKPFIYPEPDEKHDTTDKAHSDSGRADMTSKYHSLYLASPLHGYQPAEYLNSGVRPVQSCQEYTEDTSSSDDEGKLIIEL